MSTTLNILSDPYGTLIKRHKDFEMKLRGSTLLYTIPKHPLKYRVVNKAIPRKHLPFISRIKKHVAKSGREFEVDRQGIKYAMINPKLENGFQDGEFVELDVNSAYWEIAKRLQIIDNSLYDQGGKVPKRVRLIALGSLATLTEIWNVIDYGKEEKKIFSEREPTYTNFFKICQTLSAQVMRPLFEQFIDDMFLFWVDAFIIRRDVEQQLRKEVEKFDLGLKAKPIDRLEITDTKIKCHMPGSKFTKDFPRMNRKQIFAKDHKRRIYYRQWLNSISV